MALLADNRIEQTRRMSDLSREQVAVNLQALGLKVSVRTIYRWESGETPVPDEHKLAMAEMFGVSVPWLMGWVGLDDDGEHDNNGNGKKAA